MTFPMFTPIPKDKDTKDDYQNNPMATGPYQYESYTPGAEMKLKRNPNWDPTTETPRGTSTLTPGISSGARTTSKLSSRHSTAQGRTPRR